MEWGRQRIQKCLRCSFSVYPVSYSLNLSCLFDYFLTCTEHFLVCAGHACFILLPINCFSQLRKIQVTHQMIMHKLLSRSTSSHRVKWVSANQQQLNWHIWHVVCDFRWFRDRWSRHIRHNAVCVATGGHMVCRPSGQHGLTATDGRQPRHEAFTAELSHHDTPAVGTRRRKPSLSSSIRV